MIFQSMLNAEQLLEEARDTSGIDLLDHAVREPLKVMCDSINAEGRLTRDGAEGVQRFVLRSLINRLRMQRDFNSHPEIAEQEVRAPIIVCGSTRTGSTKTHRLLAASGDFNYLQFWQSLNPALVTGDRDESPEARIADTQNFVDFYSQFSPQMWQIHPLDCRAPEEETFSLIHSFRSPGLTGMVEASAFVQWLATQDVMLQFDFLRDVLKYLQWQGYASQEKRWLLKCPFYTGMEPVLMQAFPGATLVMTHRHPVETVASTCSLFTCFRQPYTDAAINGQSVLQGLAYTMQLHMDFRAQIPELSFLDINYRDLITNPESVIKRVYEASKEPLDDQALADMMAWDANNPKDAHGSHHYSLEEFGLSEEMVSDAYTDYIAFFEKHVRPDSPAHQTRSTP